MTFDYPATIQSDSDRLVHALDTNRSAPIAWCGDWTVQDCAHHVGSLHHVVADVIAERPAANFALFKELVAPKAGDRALGSWLADGTAKLVDQIRGTPADDPCWSFWPPVRTVAFWPRRIAHETLVHRWDTERAAGVEIVAADPELAADGVDEYVDVFVGLRRAMTSAPGAGETAHVHCTDTAGEWFIEFPTAGERVLRREHAKGDVAFRGPAESLLLYFWGRLPADDAGVDIVGDTTLAARWAELAPPI